jgi:hypothetical protein
MGVLHRQEHPNIEVVSGWQEVENALLTMPVPVHATT